MASSRSNPTMKQRTLQQVFRFSLHPIHRFEGTCATYKQPVEITSFSYDSNKVLHMDDRELRYYYPPNLVEEADLKNGYDAYIPKENAREPIDALLDALFHHQQKTGEKTISSADVVSWRGIFTKILCTPFARNEPWELGATLWNEHETDWSTEQANALTPQHKEMMYWGYKFETLCTIPKPPKEIKSSDDPDLVNRKLGLVNTNIQYCSVAKATLGRNRLIMGAEVDCSDDVKPPPPQNPVGSYVELKTSKVIQKEKEQFTFERFKLLKCWAQSFLIGTPKIVFGFRNEMGILQSVKEFKTLEIPRIVRGKPGMWDPTICLNFANQFLEWLRKVVVIDDPRTSYTIMFRKPFKNIEVVHASVGKSAVAERFMSMLEDSLSNS
ncbi:11407_t:CDS:2 [Ambispora gerdemannii]|uniref:Decapping nuclease n=1 Tax=Ambispora gerdemannii TaxID=144530 RepID=A0A9N8YP87_9GLOM|nr:11407_t:CDS:2 [Ambispora gerdemannii]